MIREFNKVTELYITGLNYEMNVLITIIGCIFPLTYSYIMFVICELNWVDVLNNTINELSDDDEDYLISKDTFLPLTKL